MNGVYKSKLYVVELYLHSELVSHKRATYDILGLLGDMGGIQGILISLLGVLVVPISAHSFTVKAARKLFMARSSKGGIFEEVPDE